jgi:cobalamin biosynthesis Mg chelatase CobN
VPDAFSRRLLLPIALLALVVATALALAAAPGAAAKAKTCGEQVVDDWYGNGRVDQIFPTHCYLDAIRSLPVDVKDYSNAEEDIRRALAYARQHETDPGPTGGPAPTSTGPVEPPTTTTTATTPSTTDPGETTDTSEDPGSATVAAPGVDTSGPSSVPIPLLVLGGLALLLLAAGAAGYLSRRSQARRNGGPPGPA